jgi:hypothetical protein
MTMSTVSDVPAQFDRTALIERSRVLHQMAERHFHGLTSFLSPVQARQQAKRFMRLRPFAGGSGEQGVFLLELAAWTAEKGRSTALERYARQSGLSAASDEAAVLAGMQVSVISMWTVQEEHPVAGWIVRDLANEGTVWVVDASLGEYLAAGGSLCFLARLFRAEEGGFWMTCGTMYGLPEKLSTFGLGREGKEDAVLSGSPRHVASSRQSAYVSILYATITPLG